MERGRSFFSILDPFQANVRVDLAIFGLIDIGEVFFFHSYHGFDRTSLRRTTFTAAEAEDTNFLIDRIEGR